jgi:hypothetical protein
MHRSHVVTSRPFRLAEKPVLPEFLRGLPLPIASGMIAATE